MKINFKIDGKFGDKDIHIENVAEITYSDQYDGSYDAADILGRKFCVLMWHELMNAFGFPEPESAIKAYRRSMNPPFGIKPLK